MRSLRASFLILALVAVGCGRGGLGDFEINGETGIDEDTAIDDTGTIDTGEFEAEPPPDTWVEWDSEPPPPDTWVEWDSEPPPPDTWVEWDTGVVDTWVPPDTWEPPPDTGIADTSVPDTWLPPDTDFDTGVFDTGVVDTGTDGGPPEGGILCGSDSCDPASEQCCANLTGLSCRPRGMCSGGTTLDCSSSASCGFGQVCCFGGLGGGTPSASCQPLCLGIQLCATDAECSPMQRCQATFGGYRICR